VKSLRTVLQGLLVIPVLALGVSAFMPVAQPVQAFDQGITDGANAAQGKDQQGNAACLFGGTDNCSGDGIFKTVTNVLLFIIGAVAVIMLIIGGIRYTVSGGDSGAVTSAKNTILYAVVGIIVAILAFAIVNFVLGSFGN
jgi:hypothetical protein